jgi:hypothetical protein
MNCHKTLRIKKLPAVFSILCWVACGFSQTAQIAKDVFAIPKPPNVELVRNGEPLNHIDKPFFRTLRIYKTEDGKSLNPEELIQFYKTYFYEKGWKDAPVYKREGNEPYLGLSIQIYDPPTVHAVGDFYIWIFPQDGMFTIYMEQWRISDDPYKDKTIQIINALKSKAQEMNYSVTPACEFGNWLDYYSNEYLADCQVFMLADKSIENRSCIDPKGRINATILTYTSIDTATSAREKEEETTQPKTTEKLHSGKGTRSISPLKARTVIQKGNTVIFLESQDKTQTNSVTELTQFFKNK